MKEETKQWLSEKFSIPTDDILWYNSGTCYDRIGVKTEESAKKVTQAVRGGYVNGGMYDGMPLGSCSPSNDGTYDIMC